MHLEYSISSSPLSCRHLYQVALRDCYLFQGCKPKFLDAVMAACRADMFM